MSAPPHVAVAAANGDGEDLTTLLRAWSEGDRRFRLRGDAERRFAAMLKERYFYLTSRETIWHDQ